MFSGYLEAAGVFDGPMPWRGVNAGKFTRKMDRSLHLRKALEIDQQLNIAKAGFWTQLRMDKSPINSQLYKISLIVDITKSVGNECCLAGM
jgi:hypothetical protein